MTLVLGTSSGFVSVAPTADPDGDSQLAVDNYAICTRHTSPAGVTKVTEIGWYCNGASENTNIQLGLYGNDGSDGNAGTLLFNTGNNPKGSAAGWIKVTVDWTITPNTIYWLAVQVDNTVTTTNLDIQTGQATSVWTTYAGASSLANPFNLQVEYTGQIGAIYALYESAPPTGGHVIAKKW